MPVTLIKGKARKLAVLEHRRLMLDRALRLLAQGRVNPEYVRLRGDKLREVMGNGKS